MTEKKALAIVSGLTFGAAALSQAFSGGKVQATYARLTKPPWSPPDWVFAPVWTVLYAEMSIAAWRVWRRRTTMDVTPALTLYATQLALNAWWSPLFFGAKKLKAARNEMVVLLGAILATARAFSKADTTAAALLVPYALWVSFALALNASIVDLNPDG